METPDSPEFAPKTGLLDRFRLMLVASREEAEQAQARLEATTRQASALQNRLKALLTAVEEAESSLARADDQWAARKADLLAMQTGILEGWGNPAIPGGPTYTNLIALRAAVEDFPRARQHLLTKVTTAKRALVDFEKKYCS